MKAIDLCNILERNYRKGQFQCNMDSDTCGSKPCDLCTVEKFEKEVRADEQTTVLKDLYASDKSSTLKELLNIARAEARTEFTEWLEENSYKYIESFWQGHSIGEALEDFEKEKKNEI